MKDKPAFPVNFNFYIFIFSFGALVFFFFWINSLFSSGKTTFHLEAYTVYFIILVIPFVLIAFWDMYRGGFFGYVIQLILLIATLIYAINNFIHGYIDIMAFVSPALIVELLLKYKHLIILKHYKHGK
jgi:hypothetical protein